MIFCMSLHKKKMFNRTLHKIINTKLYQGKAIIIIGARQTGKTTIAKNIATAFEEEALYLNTDENNIRHALTNVSVIALKQILGKAKFVLIDEAQRIVDVGITLKLIVDNFPHIQLLVTGSYSLELMSVINEPLTGRKFEYKLYPISWAEYREKHHFLEAKASLENRLIYGISRCFK
jgi:predicted AAA+ superfamily ATPase